MNQYRDFGKLDDQALSFGDGRFERLDMRNDPAALAPGSVQVSENMRFDVDGAQVRGGISRQLTAGDTVETIHCAGVYRPDADNDRIALVNATRLTLFNPATQETTRYDFPAGETVTADDDIDLIQAGLAAGTTKYLYILRGWDKDVLRYDGAAVAVDPDFKRATTGIFHEDRMGVISSAHGLNASDFLDYTIWSALAQFQVLKGSDDYLLHLRSYQKDFVLIGSRKRWFVAHFDPTVSNSAGTGYDGGLKDESFLRLLTAETGTVGKRAAHESNGKIWTVADRAIHAFQPRLDLELTVLGVPISAPIQPIMNRLSADYATTTSIQHSGHRQYFALPVSGEPMTIVDAEATAVGALTVPFTLPSVIGGGYLVTFETEEAHGMAEGDLVQIARAVDRNFNVTRPIVSTPTDDTFVVSIADLDSGDVGARATVQQIATRPNMIAVWNFALPKQSPDPDAPAGAWESIDVLPADLFADFLVVADAPGGQRRLWVVDADLGPCLYEDGDDDEVGEDLGVLRLPFTLPAVINAANFGSTAIAGRLKSRTYQWGMNAREVKAGSARLQLGDTDAGTLTLTVRTPNRPAWEASKDFDGTHTDAEVRKRCGRRGIEAELELVSTSGRPAVRALLLEVMNTGRDKEA